MIINYYYYYYYYYYNNNNNDNNNIFNSRHSVGVQFFMLRKKPHIYNTENTSLTTRSEIPGSFQKGKCRVIVPSDLKKYINSEIKRNSH